LKASRPASSIWSARSGPAASSSAPGAGGYAATRIYETPGVYLPPHQQTAEGVAANIGAIIDPAGQDMFIQAGQQTGKFVQKAAAYHGVKLGSRPGEGCILPTAGED
jgi:hypothetical protein